MKSDAIQPLTDSIKAERPIGTCILTGDASGLVRSAERESVGEALRLEGTSDRGIKPLLHEVSWNVRTELTGGRGFWNEHPGVVIGSGGVP